MKTHRFRHRVKPMYSCLMHAGPSSRHVIGTALLIAACVLPGTAAAQSSPRDDLLALVPPDIGFCVLVNDLRGHAEKWDRAPWVQSLRQASFVKAVLDTAEARQFVELEKELKKFIGVDFPTLRDDIFGDAFLFAFRPGTPAHPEQEQGMIALRAARPKPLAELVDRFNAVQKASGELKQLDALVHRGATYYRRAHVKNTHFYYLSGSLLIAAGSEDMLRQAIDRDLGKAAQSSPWPARFKRAGAENALVTVGVNPRAFEPFGPPAKGEKPNGFPGFWHALDGVFISLAIDPALELRLTLQGRPLDMPGWARSLFADAPIPSVLWQRFPDTAIVAMAARTDFANLANQLLDALPAAERRNITDAIQTGLGPFTRLDIIRDVLPNLGPDWGLCVLPPKGAGTFPQFIAAIGVKPGNGPEPVDETLFKGAQVFAGIAVADYNAKNPTTPIQIDTINQGKVVVKVLTQDKIFPPGFRPACAIKDGFLLVASSPDAIARFAPYDAPPAIKGSVPLLRVSPPALAMLLKARRDQVLLALRDKHQLSDKEAAQTFDELLGLLDLFESITFSQHGEAGQASWALRIQPRGKS